MKYMGTEVNEVLECTIASQRRQSEPEKNVELVHGGRQSDEVLFHGQQTACWAAHLGIFPSQTFKWDSLSNSRQIQESSYQPSQRIPRRALGAVDLHGVCCSKQSKREVVDEVNSIQDVVRYRGCTSSTPLLLSPIILIFMVYLTLSFSHKLRYVYPKMWEDKRVNSSEKNIFLNFFPDKCPPISEIL